MHSSLIHGRVRNGHACTTVLNRDNFGPVTLFRAYPPGVDTFWIKEKDVQDKAYRELLLTYNEYNRKVYRYVHTEAKAGRGGRAFISGLLTSH